MSIPRTRTIKEERLTDGSVDPVIRPEVIEPDVIQGFKSFTSDLLVDRAPTTVDGPVLPRHDVLETGFYFDVAGETRKLRNQNDHL